MAMSPLTTHTFALDTADALAYLSVLIPELKKDLKVENWRRIDPFLAKELVTVYKKEFIPWFKPLIDDLYRYDQDDEPEATT